MKMFNNKQNGFTLIEIAIVLLVVSILLGYTVALFPKQQELKKYRAADREMDDIIKALIGFAQVNGRLPCPDTSGGPTPGVVDGQADWADTLDNVTGAGGGDGVRDGCEAYHGFLPAATIGITGDFDANRSLLDPWGQPYHYHVSPINIGIAPAVDLVSPNGIREEGLSLVVPDLFVCDDSDNASGNSTSCAGVSGNNVAINVAAVLLSTGKDIGLISNKIQDENLDDFHDGTNDKVYTATTRSDEDTEEYDDVVKWISTSTLFSKMIEADQLP